MWLAQDRHRPPGPARAVHATVPGAGPPVDASMRWTDTVRMRRVTSLRLNAVGSAGIGTLCALDANVNHSHSAAVAAAVFLIGAAVLAVIGDVLNHGDAPPEQPPPGWYRHNDSSDGLRWWDGGKWTDQTQPDAPVNADTPKPLRRNGWTRR